LAGWGSAFVVRTPRIDRPLRPSGQAQHRTTAAEVTTTELNVMSVVRRRSNTIVALKLQPGKASTGEGDGHGTGNGSVRGEKHWSSPAAAVPRAPDKWESPSWSTHGYRGRFMRPCSLHTCAHENSTWPARGPGAGGRGPGAGTAVRQPGAGAVPHTHAQRMKHPPSGACAHAHTRARARNTHAYMQAQWRRAHVPTTWWALGACTQGVSSLDTQRTMDAARDLGWRWMRTTKEGRSALLPVGTRLSGNQNEMGGKCWR
jgi:hypothetical protein